MRAIRTRNFSPNAFWDEGERLAKVIIGNVMVKNGHSATEAIRQVSFHNPRLQSLGVDTLTVSSLRGKRPPEYFARPERLEFYQLIYFTGGRGVHQLDFRYYQIRRGTLIAVQPKQVQQFHLNPSLKGRLLLIEPGFLAASDHGVAETPSI
ncbi:MAG: AraC family ligand binding domain-containing protein [Bryobacterales bacterium]|nr:AraC family ligand binding domain-containing protein [Bryobacterales bacterium]